MRGTRKGITPVVAIILLLMMTIAAAGAAFAWIQSVMGQQQQVAECQVNTQMKVASITCFGGTSDMRVSLINVGRSTVDVMPVTALGKKGGSKITMHGPNLQSGNIEDVNAWKQASAPGNYSAPTNLTFKRGTFQKSNYYQIELRFPEDQCVKKVQTDCIAQ